MRSPFDITPIVYRERLNKNCLGGPNDRMQFYSAAPCIQGLSFNPSTVVDIIPGNVICNIRAQNVTPFRFYTTYLD